MKRFIFILPAVLSASLAAPAFAQTRGANDEAPPVLLTMAQAVVIAESMGNGPATKARLDGTGSQSVYKIKVHPRGEAPLKLDVAAVGGRIVASRRDHGAD